MQPAHVHEPDTATGITTPQRPETTSVLVHLWVHQPESSSHKNLPEAIFNYDLFPNGSAKPGDLIEVTTATEVRGHKAPPSRSKDGEHTVSNLSGVQSATSDRTNRRSQDFVEDKKRKRFLFVIREWTNDDRQKQPHLQVLSSFFHNS